MPEFVFDSEIDELRELVTRFCDDVSSEAQVRVAMESDSGFDQRAWMMLATELGVVGLGASEEYDGSGVGLVAQAVVFEALGKALFPGPVVGTMVLALPLLNSLTDAQAQSRYIPGIVDGSSIATVAGPIYDAGFSLDSVTIAAEPVGNSWSLSGAVEHVPDLLSAHVILVPARTSQGIAIFAIDAEAPGVRRTNEPTMDQTRRQGSLTLDSAEGVVIANETEAPEIWASSLRRGTVLLAAEQLGGAQHMLDTTVTYVGQRIQFGRIIGSFQTIKHRCADMLILVEQARSAVYHAAWSIDDGSDDPALAVALAKSTTSTMYRKVVADAIQLHGGIGFTWEHQAHLYYKRATADSFLLGQAEDHLDQLARVTLDSRSVMA